MRRAAAGLLVGAAAVAAVSVLIAGLKGFADPFGLTGLYLLAILPVAIGWGFRLAGIVAVASFLTFAYFFSPPHHSFRIAERDTAAALVIALVTAYVVSELARRAHERAGEAQQRAQEAEHAQAELGLLAAEQDALRRVATLVAQAVPTLEVFEAVTREVGLRCEAELARMERFEADGTVTAVAAWGRRGESDLAVGATFTLEGTSIAAQVRTTGRPARVDTFEGASGPIAREAQDVGIRSSVGCPIIVGGRTWGAIAASTTSEAPFPPDTESRIAEFTDLAAAAIANAQALEDLRRVADEQATLRRVATLVARAAPPPAVFAAVAEEVGRLLSADITGLSRYNADGSMTEVASWSATGDTVQFGRRYTSDDAGLSGLVRDTGRPARIDHYADTHVASTVSPFGVRAALAAPITVGGRMWGTIAVAFPGDASPPPGTVERLGGFAELVATAIANADSQTELKASRARIAATADETRRRIERDLHDGAQHRLVTLALKLRGAQGGIPPELHDLQAELEDITSGIRNVLDELRELARGLHPTILSDGGLTPALNALARRSAVRVAVDVRTTERLPEPIEVGAYYVVSEALTNAAKHAHARSVAVSVEAVDGVLHVCVRDDGIGGADFAGGSGLVGLRDRVDALGGHIAVKSAPNEGTAVRVNLPLDTDRE